MTTTPTAERDHRWQADLAGPGLGGLLTAIDDPLEHLAEDPITGRAGSYWGDLPAGDRAVDQAMAQLERLVRWSVRHQTPKNRTLMLAAIDRALADPENGFLRRLRRERSATLRERVGAGESVATLAVELDLSETRIRTLINNNKTYISADRQVALEALREEGVRKREAARREREAERARAAAERLAARVAEGRALAARLAAGATRAELMAETGYSRQKIAALLADARRADEAEAATELPAAA